MIRSPIGLRIATADDVKERMRQAAKLGAKGVLLEAIGELGPDKLSETGRRDLRHTLRSVELGLVGISLPTRRPFDSFDELDVRLDRAERAFGLAYDLGTRLVLCRVGAVPPESESARLEAFRHALTELARRAGHRGIRLAMETGPDEGQTLRAFLDTLDNRDLAASIDPSALLAGGNDPVQATRVLDDWVAHAYATDSTGPARSAQILQRKAGFPVGGLDWEEYLGSLEEIDYRGYLTLWPDPALDLVSQVQPILDRFKQF